jgi:hypothetical protein
MEKSIDELAEERASRAVPLPKYKAPQFGGLGVMTTLGIVIVFGSLTGVSPDAAFWPTLILSGLGFAAPYFYARNIENRHSEVFSKEYLALREAQNAQRT